MAGENTVSTLNGLFKTQYHDKLEDLVPDHCVLQREALGIDWVPSDKTNGAFYAVPTVLRSNQGVTYLGEAGGVSALNAVANGQMVEAQVYGTEINVRGQMSYKALAQAAGRGEQAFKRASAWLVEDLARVAHTRLEISALYGQSNIGVVESVNDAGGNSATIVVTAATFAPGIWILLEGAKLVSFTGSSANSVTSLTLDSVNTATRTLNITYGGTFDVAAADVLFPLGAATAGGSLTFSEMAGLYKQMTATTGTLFNIARGTYTLAQGNTYTSTGALTKAKIIDAASRVVDKGCMSDMVCLVSSKAWAVLWAEDAALRVFDSSYSADKGQTGAKNLVYEHVSGSIKVVAHPLVKQGEALLFAPDNVIWVGASKPTFSIPGVSDEEFFRLVDGYNAVELQNFSDCAVYVLKPAQCIVMTGITYS